MQPPTDSLETAGFKELKALFVKRCVITSQTLSYILKGQQFMASQSKALCNQLKALAVKNHPCRVGVPVVPTTSEERTGRRRQPCKISFSVSLSQSVKLWKVAFKIQS